MPGNDDDEDDSDGGYKKRKAKKGDAAYAEFLASQNYPSSVATEKVANKGNVNQEDDDKKPAAKVSLNCSFHLLLRFSFTEDLLGFLVAILFSLACTLAQKNDRSRRITR